MPGLRVLTLNTWLLRWGRFRVARDLAPRAAAIPEAVARTGADVVALQEVWLPDVAAALAQRFRTLGYPHVLAAARRRPLRLLGSGLMIVSRHPLQGVGDLAFRRKSVWYEFLIGKGALAADVALPGGETLRVVTAHLGVVRFDVRRGAFRAGDARTRRAQVEELAHWMEGLAGRPEHLVVAGDLNLADRIPANGRPAAEPAPDYAHLLERMRMVDAYREHDARAPGFTFDPATNAHAARGRCHRLPGQRIDYVLYRAAGGLKAERAAIVFRDPPPLSDHYGLLADFVLTRAYGPAQRAKISASSAGGVTSSWS